VPAVDFNLYLVCDRKQIAPRPLPDFIEAAAQGGVSAVQFREKDLPLSQQLALALAIQRVTKRYGIKLFINDRVDICMAIDAEGVHLPASGLPVTVARKLLGNHKWIGVSCHSLEEVRCAEAVGADFALLGPVYETPSKRAFGPPLGIERFRQVRRATRIPLFAVGGIHKARISEVMMAGASGISLISEVASATDVRKRCQELRQELAHFHFSPCDSAFPQKM
jgi:thiamine-phosphate pyrophosphorylase